MGISFRTKSFLYLILFTFAGNYSLADIASQLKSKDLQIQTVMGPQQLKLLKFEHSPSEVVFSKVLENENGLKCSIGSSFSSEEKALQYFSGGNGKKMNWKLDSSLKDSGLSVPFLFESFAVLKGGRDLKVSPMSVRYFKEISAPCLEYIDQGQSCFPLEDGAEFCQPNIVCSSKGLDQFQFESIFFNLISDKQDVFKINCRRQFDFVKSPEIQDLQLNDLNLLSPVIKVSIQ